MLVKVFVLGSPGSGKSTAIQLIGKLANGRDIHTTSIIDYTILREMFEQDIEHKRFQSAEHDGFDVTDFSVLDEALKKIEIKVRGLEDRFTQRNGIVMIEFARNDYIEALNNFTAPFLKDAHFLFINAELEEACIERIHKRRMGNSFSKDRHSVSDEIMRSYYATHNWSDTLNKLRLEGHSLRRVTTLDNNGLEDDFNQRVTTFAEGLFDETLLREEASNNFLSPFNNYRSSLLIMI